MLLRILILFHAILAVKLEEQRCGVPLKVDEPFPWLVSVTTEGKDRCGGALLNEYYVLTTASCVERLKNIAISLGTKNKVTVGVHENIDKSHASYLNGSVYHAQFDLAILRLAEAVAFSEEVKPVCLPSDGETVENGESLHADLRGYPSPGAMKKRSRISVGEDSGDGEGSGESEETTDDGSGEPSAISRAVLDQLKSVEPILQWNVFSSSTPEDCVKVMTAVKKLKSKNCTTNDVECSYEVTDDDDSDEPTSRQANPDHMLCLQSHRTMKKNQLCPDRLAFQSVPITKQDAYGVYRVIGMVSLVDYFCNATASAEDITVMATNVLNSQNLQWIRNEIDYVLPLPSTGAVGKCSTLRQSFVTVVSVAVGLVAALHMTQRH